MKRQMDPEALAKSFKMEPTLQCFLDIRKNNPDLDFDVSFVGGLDHLYVLEKYIGYFGISPDLFTGILDASDESIRSMCMLIIEDILQEELLKREGETHVAARKRVMPKHLRDWLICTMLGAISRYGSNYICTDLIVLLQFRLNGEASRIEEMVEVHEKKQTASWAAGRLRAQGKAVSFRAVARMMGVQPSTVKRWFTSETEFKAAGDRLSRFFDADGHLADIFHAKPKALHTE